MGNLLRKSLRSIGRQEAGFSLMEIIVAIGIMAAIAAITVPLVTRFTSTGESGAKSTEKEAFQTAVDSHMAAGGLGTITAVTNDTNSWAGTGPGSFLRTGTTTYCYTYASDGKVTQTNKAVVGADTCP